MDFSYSEDQEALRELARKILEEQVTHDRLKEIEATEEHIDRQVWAELAKSNLLGVPFSDAYGGSGMGLPELAILLEEAGRAVAPVPLHAAVVLAGLPIAEFGSDEQKQRFLPALIAGDVLLSGALTEPGAEEPLEPQATARRDGADWVLSGTKGLAPYAHVADRVLVAARVEGGLGVFLVDPQGPGAASRRVEVTNHEPHSMLELNEARVPAADVLGEPGAQGRAIVHWVMERAMLSLCCLSVGVADRALAMTAEYTRERKQFDRPIGSFQAVHQRAGDAFIDVIGMRLSMQRALHLVEAGADASDALAVAKYWSAEAGNRVTYAAQHLHGGIGLDVDYPLHRYFLWARQISQTLGGATRQLVKIGEQLAAG
jgi:alkylation response protein AidB-like acyl-CoA dehydrogenase